MPNLMSSQEKINNLKMGVSVSDALKTKSQDTLTTRTDTKENDSRGLSEIDPKALEQVRDPQLGTPTMGEDLSSQKSSAELSNAASSQEPTHQEEQSKESFWQKVKHSFFKQKPPQHDTSAGSHDVYGYEGKNQAQGSTPPIHETPGQALSSSKQTSSEMTSQQDVAAQRNMITEYRNGQRPGQLATKAEERSKETPEQKAELSAEVKDALMAQMSERT